MSRRALFTCAAVVLVAGFSGSASAFDWFNVGQNEVYSSTTQLPLVAVGGCDGQCACDDGCDDCCRGCWIADAEALFFRYYRIDGVQNVANPNVQFGFPAAPRLTLGYVGPEGLGFRVRYFIYDHSASNGTDSIDVRTWTLDQEVFDNIQLTDNTRVEFSGGIRYAEFQERLLFTGPATPTENTQFRGFGGILGMQVNRQLWRGELYGRGRYSVLVDEKTFATPATELRDAITSITELSMGYQINYNLSNGALLTLRSGLEWQHWTDFSVDQNTGGDTPSSVGFFGFVMGGGLNY